MGLWKTLYVYISGHVLHDLSWLPGYRSLADGKFATTKTLVPKCLDSYGLITIRKFFQKSWRYLDAYKQGLDARQVALANKKYKSYHKIELPRDMTKSIDKGII